MLGGGGMRRGVAEPWCRPAIRVRLYAHGTDAAEPASLVTLLATDKGSAKQEHMELQHFYEDAEWVGNGEKITCLRIVSMTCVAQPLVPIILGFQLQYEVVTDSEVFDGDRYV